MVQPLREDVILDLVAGRSATSVRLIVADGNHFDALLAADGFQDLAGFGATERLAQTLIELAEDDGAGRLGDSADELLHLIAESVAGFELRHELLRFATPGGAGDRQKPPANRASGGR